MRIDSRSVVTLGLYIALNMFLAVSWHVVLFKNILSEATPFARPEPIIPLGLAAMVLHGLLLMGVYPRFHRSDSPLASGATFGALVGLFLAAGAIWVDVGKFRFKDGFTYLTIETVYEVASFTALGTLLALRYRPLASNEAR